MEVAGSSPAGPTMRRGITIQFGQVQRMRSKIRNFTAVPHVDVIETHEQRVDNPVCS